MYKYCIKVLLDSLSQIINLKLEINCLYPESILISENIELKINVLPSFFAK